MAFHPPYTTKNCQQTKKWMMIEIGDLPRVTIVTVCYNAVGTLDRTILSVLKQNYPNVEYIIIDGGSTDGTVDVINRHCNRDIAFISEPDKGIYDAMNKGIKMATGEWICFMNSGDTFVSNDILSRIFSGADYKDTDVIYGDARYCYVNAPIDVKAQPLSTLDYKMAFCHQSSFVRTNLMKSRNFDLKYKYAADYNYFHELYLAQHKFFYIPIVIAVYSLEDGFTASNIVGVLREESRISGKRDMIWVNRVFHTYISFLLHKIIPRRIFNILRKRLLK